MALNDLLDAIKGTAADKEYICRVDLDELLMRMLCPPCGGNREATVPLKDLQQCLLNALSRNITGYRRIFWTSLAILSISSM